MIVTKNKVWADKARFLSTQARDKALHYEHSHIGYNYRLSNICAAIGLGQMSVLDDRVSRKSIFDRYFDQLNIKGINLAPEPNGYKSSRWLTALTVDPQKTRVTNLDIINMLNEHQWSPDPVEADLQPIFMELNIMVQGLMNQLVMDFVCHRKDYQELKNKR